MNTFENVQDFVSIEAIAAEMVEKVQYYMGSMLGAATVATTIAVYTGGISLVSIPVFAVGVGYCFRTLTKLAIDAYYLLKKTVINLVSEVYGNVTNVFNVAKSIVVKTIDVVKSVVINPVDAVKSGFNKLCSWFSS